MGICKSKEIDSKVAYPTANDEENSPLVKNEIRVIAKSETELPGSECTSKKCNSSTSPLDVSEHSSASQPKNNGIGHNQNAKPLKQSSSVLGLDKIIDDRKAEGDLMNNIVHMEVPFGKPIEEVYDGVHDGTVLGSGISGLVRLCTHKATGVKFAVKSLDLGLVETEEGVQQLREEIAIMCQLDHPNIVRLEEVYESHSEIYLVQELCVGGELFDRLDEQPDYHYSEAQCARLVKQMICSVRYIHSKGIIHRDLKLENFLFSTTEPDSELKMIDFGLSKHFKFGEVQHQAVGTPYTVAPEVIRGSYDERCDVWAIGVIAYLLLCGDPPFGGCGGPESLMQVRSNILQGHFSFQPEEIWNNVSQHARNFIYLLLVTDPNSRPTAKDCQMSPWLIEWADKDRKDKDNKLNPEVVKALVKFKEYSDMRKLLCEVLSFTLLPDQITDLRKEFEKLDTDGSGEISLQGLKQVLMENAGAGSLGALTETEVEDIFNAMRVRKTETTIHWHEFIAAGLSQCQVDDRNLQIAFERLDSDHKGYITFSDVMDLMGRDGAGREEAMRRTWGDSMRMCNSKNAQIYYEDFLLLMKGQTKEDFSSCRQYTLNKDLHVLQESRSNSESTEISNDENPITLSNKVTKISPTGEEPSPLTLCQIDPIPSMGLYGPTADDMSDGPLTMEDDDSDEAISKYADNAVKHKMGILTPPQSPVRGAIDYITPTAQRFNAFPENVKPGPAIPSTSVRLQPIRLTRGRSKSVDDQDNSEDEPHFVPDTRRAVLLPEHTHHEEEIDTLIKDETKTPLVVNRKLYRAHRQMRLAVLEASKRFEDQQIKRTKEELQANERFVAAGLVMRHGHKKELSSEAIRTLMKEKQKEQHQRLEVANKRGGRGKRTRKKTISDMSAMLTLVPSDNFSPSLGGIASPFPEEEPTPRVNLMAAQDESPQFHLHEMTHRKPTVPGVFRKTNDPFRHMGNSMDVLGLSNYPTESITNKQTVLSTKVELASAMKISLSDGELNQHDGDPATSSPEVVSTGNNMLIKSSPSWPPPPPPL